MTPLKEQLSEVLLSHLPVVVVTMQSGVIRYATPGAEALLGYFQNSLIGEPIEKLIPEQLRERHERHRASFALAPRQRSMGAALQLEAVKRDGTTFPVEIALYPARIDGVDSVCAVITSMEERQGLPTG